MSAARISPIRRGLSSSRPGGFCQNPSVYLGTPDYSGVFDWALLNCQLLWLLPSEGQRAKGINALANGGRHV